VDYIYIRNFSSVLALILMACDAAAAAQQLHPWHDPSKHRMLFVTVEDGVRLEVLDWGGSGRPVALLAGLGVHCARLRWICREDHRLVSRVRNHATRVRSLEPTGIRVH
jgi:hypothetical protein